MQTLNANEAKTKFDTMLVNVQSEPIEIVKNGSPVAVVMSRDAFNKIDELKLELVRSRFENIGKEDLMTGADFFAELNSGKYD
jgi:prevent-host-death family protein